jgi:LPPG:FO 2-phospho-L-lactate transferase
VIVVLTGGTGGAKFAQGLKQVVPPGELTFIVNTGDDLRWWGFNVSPDVDSITYALAGTLSRERGWGVEGDTFEALEVMRRMGAPAWFQIGDRDLALHKSRTEMLAAGKLLSQATAEIAQKMGIESRILPMTDDRLETRIQTPAGELGFQEYFVRERYQVAVERVFFTGAEQARPAPGVVEAIAAAEVILVAPSNPVTSIGPILAVPGIRETLRETRARVAAVSPIVGGAAVSGPAGELMKTQGLAVSAAGVAQAYAGFLDVLIVDERDAAEKPAVEKLGVELRTARTVMKSDVDKAELAWTALEIARKAAAVAR